MVKSAMGLQGAEKGPGHILNRVLNQVRNDNNHKKLVSLSGGKQMMMLPTISLDLDWLKIH